MYLRTVTQKEEEEKKKGHEEQMLHLLAPLLFPPWPGVMEG